MPDTPDSPACEPRAQSRSGTEDNAAHVLEQSDAQTVLTLHSELATA